VLITGAAGGIGRATTKAFRTAGWRTIATDVVAPSEPTGADRFIAADLADPARIETLVGELSADPGELHAVVNNAALQVARPFPDTTLDDFDRVMAVNVRAPFWLIHEALPLLPRTGSAIVNVSSVHAVATSREIAAYAASKGALVALTRALALELADHGVRVNAILPGAVDTEMLRAGLGRSHAGLGDIDERLATLAGRHPLGRIGRADDIARAILYLADDDRSSFVTGTCLVVDGGVTARLSSE
jgi:NAD(P)-dependent dehydrogenase (short-subunit alcohol dehydrogenase family)